MTKEIEKMVKSEILSIEKELSKLKDREVFELAKRVLSRSEDTKDFRRRLAFVLKAEIELLKTKMDEIEKKLSDSKSLRKKKPKKLL